MHVNEGVGDRAIRIAMGVILLALAALYPLFQTKILLVLGAIGLVPFLTGAIGFCPLYRIVGFSTKEEPATGH